MVVGRSGSGGDPWTEQRLTFTGLRRTQLRDVELRHPLGLGDAGELARVTGVEGDAEDAAASLA